jgi:hypothetical protein
MHATCLRTGLDSAARVPQESRSLPCSARHTSSAPSSLLCRDAPRCDLSGKGAGSDFL